MVPYSYRKIAGFMIGVIFLFAAIIAYAEKPLLYKEPLSAAIQASGVKAEEMSINGWARLPLTHNADADLESMVCRAMEQLGIDAQNYQITHHQTKNQRFVRAEAVSDYFHAVAIAEVMYPSHFTKESELYLVLTIETKARQEEEIMHWNHKITEILRNFGGMPHISSCLVGWLDGKLLDEEWTIRLQKAFTAANATVIDKTAGENFASFTGYTSAIADYLEVGGKRINLNMALRYSPYDNRTYVTIGSPVIAREY